MRYLILFFSLWIVSPVTAQEFYDHNGSLMRLEQHGNDVFIYYDKPRPGLMKVGVHPGRLLFRGILNPGGLLDGKSRIFSRRCGEQDYAARGNFASGKRLVLRGAVPVRAKDSCRIVGSTFESSNANLIFTPLSQKRDFSTPSSARSRTSKVGTSCVINVRPGSTLNMRTGPTLKHGVVGEIPAASCNVVVGDTCVGDWCGVRHGGDVGWVNLRFLKQQ